MNPTDFVNGYGHTVVLKGREDLFSPETSEDITCDDGTVLPGIQLYVNDTVTSIPDRIGCCEVISVGSEVSNVKPGDIAFIDFYDIRQGVILECEERYIANDDAFKAVFEVDTGTLVPLAGYAITKSVPNRFKIALNGNDLVHVPPMVLTTGIVSGYAQVKDKNTDELITVPAAWTVYEEVVSVGLPIENSPTRPLYKAEKEFMDSIWYGDAVDIYDAIEKYTKWRASRKELDVKKGDLVAFCTDLAVKVRIKGEFQRLVPQSAILCTIDDEAILDRSIRAGRSNLVKVA